MPLPLLLLVDDAPELADIVTYLGKRSGLEVSARSDVPTAWEFLRSRRPDLLLLDVNLPGISGPELCQQIRATPDLADLAIALFSHWGLPADVAAGLAAGADFVVSKELISQPAAWRQRLQEILEAKDSRGALHRVGLEQQTGIVSILPNWPKLLNEVLRTRALRQMGPEVLRVVVRRAFTEARTPALSENTIGSLMMGDGLLKPVPELDAALNARAVTILFASLALQMGRLFGAEASRPFREALVEIIPGLSGLPTQ